MSTQPLVAISNNCIGFVAGLLVALLPRVAVTMDTSSWISFQICRCAFFFPFVQHIGSHPLKEARLSLSSRLGREADQAYGKIGRAIKNGASEGWDGRAFVAPSVEGYYISNVLIIAAGNIHHNEYMIPVFDLEGVSVLVSTVPALFTPSSASRRCFC